MKKFFLVVCILQLMHGNESPLSSEKEELLELKRQKIEQDASINRKSWIAPVLLSVSANKSEDASKLESTSKNAALVWNQDLFRSGGIFAIIEQADAYKELNLLGVDQEEAQYLKQIYTLKLQLKRDTLKYHQSTLTLKNRDIDFDVVKAKYRVGNVDINELNSITLDRDNAKISRIKIQDLIDTETMQLKKLIGTKKIETIAELKVPLISKVDYVKHHFELIQYDARIKNDDAARKITNASYLPKLTLNVSAGYSDYDTYRAAYDGKNYSYGISASMPFDINEKAAIESSRLQYLQTKISKVDRKKELEKEYSKHLHAIKNYQAKIKVAQEMIQIYKNLYELAKKQYDNGLKTKYDIQSLRNSLKIQELEKEIQVYNIDIEKVTLYFDVKH